VTADRRDALDAWAERERRKDWQRKVESDRAEREARDNLIGSMER
jgi:hypothetical protein